MKMTYEEALASYVEELLRGVDLGHMTMSGKDISDEAYAKELLEYVNKNNKM